MTNAFNEGRPEPYDDAPLLILFAIPGVLAYGAVRNTHLSTTVATQAAPSRGLVPFGPPFPPAR